MGLEAKLGGVMAARRKTGRFLGGVGVVWPLGGDLGTALKRAGVVVQDSEKGEDVAPVKKNEVSVGIARLATGLGGVMGSRGNSSVIPHRNGTPAPDKCTGELPLTEELTTPCQHTGWVDYN